MSNSAPARKEGYCVKCGDAIEVGQYYHWGRSPHVKGQWWHCHVGECDCGDQAIGKAHRGVRPKDLSLPEGSDTSSGSGQAQVNSGNKGQSGSGEAAPSGDVAPAQPTQAKADAKPDEPVKVEPTGNPLLDALMQGGLGDAIEDAMKQTQSDLSAKVEQQIQEAQSRAEDVDTKASEALQKALSRQAQDVHSKPPLEIIVKREDTGESIYLEAEHHQFPDLLDVIRLRDHAYAWGDPGGGKSTAARHAALALGLRFAYLSLSPQTQESRLFGYMDAGGVYHGGLFRDFYENGGVFCLDEMDNAAAALLTTINSMLEDDEGSFPDGMVPRHPDFVLIAAGNTRGSGADWRYPDRRQFDSAFTERFQYIEWTYDDALEAAMVKSVNALGGGWLKWVRAVREHVVKAQLPLVVSPRASMRGAKYLKNTTWDIEKIATAVLFKGADQATKDSILAAVPLPKVVEVEDDEEGDVDHANSRAAGREHAVAEHAEVQQEA